jgi:hypothetical protein
MKCKKFKRIQKERKCKFLNSKKNFENIHFELVDSIPIEMKELHLPIEIFFDKILEKENFKSHIEKIAQNMIIDDSTSEIYLKSSKISLQKDSKALKGSIQLISQSINPEEVNSNLKQDLLQNLNHLMKYWTEKPPKREIFQIDGIYFSDYFDLNVKIFFFLILKDF